jgi:hypothetical protein
VLLLPQPNSLNIHVEEATLLSLYKEKCTNETIKNETEAEHSSIIERTASVCSLHQQRKPEFQK